jgi:hypothetical protein
LESLIVSANANIAVSPTSHRPMAVFFHPFMVTPGFSWDFLAGISGLPAVVIIFQPGKNEKSRF